MTLKTPMRLHASKEMAAAGDQYWRPPSTLTSELATSPKPTVKCLRLIGNQFNLPLRARIDGNQNVILAARPLSAVVHC